MKTDFAVENPKEIELTMKITMSLGQWMELANQLGERYPSWLLGAEIGKMIREATKHFKAEQEA